MCPTESSGRSVVAMSGVESSDRRGIPSSWVTGLSMFGTSVARGWKNPEHDTTIRDHIVTGT